MIRVSSWVIELALRAAVVGLAVVIVMLAITLVIGVPLAIAAQLGWITPP